MIHILCGHRFKVLRLINAKLLKHIHLSTHNSTHTTQHIQVSNTPNIKITLSTIQHQFIRRSNLTTTHTTTDTLSQKLHLIPSIILRAFQRSPHIHVMVFVPNTPNFLISNVRNKLLRLPVALFAGNPAVRAADTLENEPVVLLVLVVHADPVARVDVAAVGRVVQRALLAPVGLPADGGDGLPAVRDAVAPEGGAPEVGVLVVVLHGVVNAGGLALVGEMVVARGGVVEIKLDKVGNTTVVVVLLILFPEEPERIG